MLGLRKVLKRERGQSVAIMGGALLALMALLALVVDSGNAYVQRRIVQNATDAAALAGSSELALTKVEDGYYVGTSKDEERIWQTIVRIAEENGIPDTNGQAHDPVNENITAYFVGPDGKRVPYTNDLPNNGGIPRHSKVSGIAVQSGKAFSTYFARLVGFDEMNAGANSVGKAPPDSGVCSAGNLFPIAVSKELFVGEGSGTGTSGSSNGPVIGKEYQIFEKDKLSSKGNFGWLTWDDTPSGGAPSNTTLVESMNDTSRSGTWHVDDWITGSTGVQVSNGVNEALQTRIKDNDPNRPAEVVVPIYDTVVGQGSNFEYHVIGFAKFRLLAYDFGGNNKYALADSLLGTSGNGNGNGNSGNKWIKGEFVNWVDSSGEGGCSYFGGTTAKLHDPRDETRKIVGSIYANKLTPDSQPKVNSAHVPVDVMLVTDISGSMNASWAGASSKLQSAKDALTTFNTHLQPDEGDRVGLTTFPLVQNSPPYSPVCWNEWGYSQKHKLTYTGEVRSSLTSNITGTNGINSTINSLTADGGTPLADGIRQGREQLLNDLASGSTPVMIIASDGIANATLDGKATGFSGEAGTGDDTPDCNNQAEQQAKQEANAAKEAGIIVFSIAIGDGFNTDVTEAIASPDHDADGDGDIERHFFVAGNDADLKAIYDQIAERMETIGQEDYVQQQQVLASNATVILENADTGSVRTTRTNDVGAFAFSDIEPGTYRVTASTTINGLTYDILTKGYGGEPLDPQYVEITVGEGTGTTESEILFLETDDLEQ